MAKAFVKDGTLYVETPWLKDGKVSASRKNVVYATTERGTEDELTIKVDGKDVTIQLNAYARKPKTEAPKAKGAVEVKAK